MGTLLGYSTRPLLDPIFFYPEPIPPARRI